MFRHLYSQPLAQSCPCLVATPKIVHLGYFHVIESLTPRNVFLKGCVQCLRDVRQNRDACNLRKSHRALSRCRPECYENSRFSKLHLIARTPPRRALLAPLRFHKFQTIRKGIAPGRTKDANDDALRKHCLFQLPKRHRPQASLATLHLRRRHHAEALTR